MELANARLVLNKLGSDVPVVGLTPAEAVVLHILHQGNNGGSTFGDDFKKITVTGEAVVELEAGKPATPAKGVVGQPGFVAAVAAVPAKNRPRTDNEELRRLTSKYAGCVNKTGQKIVKLIWPSGDAKLPAKFSELKWNEIQYDGAEVAPLNYITGQPAGAK